VLGVAVQAAMQGGGPGQVDSGGQQATLGGRDGTGERLADSFDGYILDLHTSERHLHRLPPHHIKVTPLRTRDLQ
jgi:hypothetical protein